MISQDDQWKRCKYADAQQHRSRILAGSIGLEGPWSDWIDGKPGKEFMNRQYEYRQPKSIEHLIDQSVSESKDNIKKAQHNSFAKTEDLQPYDNKALCELIDAFDKILYPNNMLKSFKKWETFLFENKEKFLKRFCQNAWYLDSFSWNSENMHFTYVLDSGQHIGDSIKLKEWFDFFEGV